MRIALSVGLIVCLAACGGSSTGPVNPAPPNPNPSNPATLNPTPLNPTPIDPTPVNPKPFNINTTITPEQASSDGQDLVRFLDDVEAAERRGINPLESLNDLRMAGDAQYSGTMAIVSDPTLETYFAGNAELNIGFDNPSNPSVTGGAGGFVYLEGDEANTATGSINFSDGRLVSTPEGVGGAGFTMNGSLIAHDSDGFLVRQNVDGPMGVVFKDDEAVGFGDTTPATDFDIEESDVRFFGRRD